MRAPEIDPAMSEQAPGLIGGVIEYVKSEFTLDGVEVKGWGTDSVTLRLPYELDDVNYIISALDYEFGGQQTFKSTSDGGMLVVVPDPAHKAPPETEMAQKRGSNVGALAAGALAALLIVLLAAALVLPDVVFSPKFGN